MRRIVGSDGLMERRMCIASTAAMSRRGVLAGTAATAVAALSPTALRAESIRWPRELAGIRVPDMPVARHAAQLMRSAAPPALYNHALRTFVLGMMDARRHGHAVDADEAFHAAILHDLALTPAYSGNPDRPFEENSADLAAAFARAAGWSDTRAERIHRGILLHAGGASGEPADIRFVMIGAGQDLFGPTTAELTDAELLAIERDVPRLSFRTAFQRILADHLTRTRAPTWVAGFVDAPPPSFIANRWSS